MTDYSPPPVKEYLSPAKEYSSPTKEYSSPAKEYSSPVKEYSSPAKEYSSPVNEYSSPATEYSSPEKEYSSPPSYKGEGRKKRPLIRGYAAPEAQLPDYKALESSNTENRILPPTRNYGPPRSGNRATFYDAPQANVVSFFDEGEERFLCIQCITESCRRLAAGKLRRWGRPIPQDVDERHSGYSWSGLSHLRGDTLNLILLSRKSLWWVLCRYVN